MRFTQDRKEQQQCTDEVLAWLSTCWQHRKDGTPILPDPFYERNNLLTEEVVADVLGGIEALMLKEFDKFDAYHRRAQGINSSQYLVPPKFLKLPYAQRFAIVQGIDRIMQAYRLDDLEPVGDRVGEDG